MKLKFYNKKFNLKNLSVLLIILFLFSCTVKKRSYMSGYYVAWQKSKPHSLKTEVTKKGTIKENYQDGKILNRQSFVDLKINGGKFSSEGNSLSEQKNKGSVRSNRKAIYKRRSETKIQDTCDVIVKKNGDEIRAIILELSVGEIKFRRCDNSGGPIYIVPKADVFMIKYANGTKEVMQVSLPDTQYDKSEKNKGKPRKTSGLAVAGFVTAILGLFVAALPLGILSLILGATGLVKMEKNPKELRGKGFAITAIVLGLIEILIGVLVLLAI